MKGSCKLHDVRLLWLASGIGLSSSSSSSASFSSTSSSSSSRLLSSPARSVPTLDASLGTIVLLASEAEVEDSLAERDETSFFIA